MGDKGIWEKQNQCLQHSIVELFLDVYHIFNLPTIIYINVKIIAIMMVIIKIRKKI